MSKITTKWIARIIAAALVTGAGVAGALRYRTQMQKGVLK
jgi:hypothetical protein